MEVFQWCAFATPLFVTGQRLAMKDWGEQPNNQSYMLIIWAMIAYVAMVTLIVWLPVKIFIVWKKIWRPYEGFWYEFMYKF